jgi:PKD repeat protein
MRIILILAVFLSFLKTTICQDLVFKSSPLDDSDLMSLNEVFKNYKTFSFDVEHFNQYLVGSRSVSDEVHLFLDGQHYTFFIEPVQILAEDAEINILSPEGKEKYRKPAQTKTYKGIFTDGRDGFMRLTVSNNFMYGLINSEGEEIYIEPLKYFIPGSRSDQFMVYHTHDVKKGHDVYHCFRPAQKKQTETMEREELLAGACYKVKLAMLADYSMFIDPAHPGVDAVIDHVVAVMNNVQSNFEYNGSTNFNDGVNFEISELTVSTCQTCDPLSAQTNAGNLLAEFSAWIDQNGFNHPFHAAHFWTNRDLDNSTVGVAFQAQNLFCQSRARALFEDWTSTAAMLKITVSHEIGHSFSGAHDASSSNFILAPSISVNNTTWSSTSKSVISGQIASQGPSCLTSCSPTPCTKPDNVIVTNINNQNFTVSWSATAQQWYTIKVKEVGMSNFIVDFNTSSSSVLISPPGYSICKEYDVYVYSNCSGNGFSAATRILNVGPTSQGCADFSINKTVGWAGSTFSFFDKSLDAGSWLWNFGNGQTSTLKNPTVMYTSPGQYNVSLMVNGVHTKNMNAAITILPNKTAPFSLSDGGDFEAVTSLFSSEVIEGSVNVWEYGTSAYVLPTQGKAWKSTLNNDIPQVTSKSALYSPVFDFSGYQNYTLFFDLGMEVAYCNAPFAVQMQYSVNNGNSWSRLGSSPGFYNAGAGAGCKIAPQIFSDTTGWTLNTYYANKSLDISFLAGNPAVIFRFVAAISGIFNGGYNVDGVLIDNFRIDAFNANPLPLVVSSLKAFAKNRENILEWESYLPTDIVKYNILRSPDGIRFNILDSVYQQSANEIFFNYTDASPLKGLNYYKIEAIHHDGSSVASNISAVRQGNVGHLQISPNPVQKNQSLQIVVSEDADLLTKPRIFDIVGKEIVIPDDKWSKNALHIDFLQSAVYFMYITLSDGSILKEKILVL